MNKRAYGQAMVTLLGLGTADLAVLNLWAVPGWLEDEPVTDMRSATDDPARATSAVSGTGHLPRTAASSDPSPPIAARDPATSAPVLPASNAAAPTAPAAVIVPGRREPRVADHRASILFHRGTWWVGPAGRRTLRVSLQQLTPEGRITVEGHADESGSAEINRRISARRASVVAGLLVQAGIDPARIDQRAHGEAQASGTGFDRRVELIIRGGP